MGILQGLFPSRDKPKNRAAGSGYSFFLRRNNLRQSGNRAERTIVSNANLHLMFDKIVIEETDEGLNLDLRLKSPFISKKKEPLLKKYMIVDNEVLSVGA